MTTTFASPSGRLELPAFGLTPEDVGSLRALKAEWSAAIDEVFSASGDDPVAIAFAGETRQLVVELDDAAWQERWLGLWRELHAQGVPGSALGCLLNAALDASASRICRDEGPVLRLHLQLLVLLRRAVMAVAACAAEMNEELQLVETGVPGELAALRHVQDIAVKGGQLAVLSVAVSNRDAFVHLSASDLQSLPARVSGRIQEQLRQQDCLFSGRDSEWLLVLPAVHSLTQPALAAASLQRAFAQPLRLSSGKVLACDIAIGAAMLPDHGNDAEAVVAASRLARWHLAVTRQPFGWFHPAIQAEWNQRFLLASEFKAAMSREALQLYLQPQIDADGGQCIGAELLLRWQRENGEWVEPPQIMAMVEEHGWRPLYTDWLFRCALRIAADLGAAGANIRLSLNLTAGDLLDDDLVDMVAQRLETWQMRGERFALELTESAMMQDRERSLETLCRLRELGFQLALDDFGTGYSSLSHLVSLPINELKIDRSFIVAMDQSEEHLRIVRTIIDLARDLGMTPLAEGVETEGQLAGLRQLGCHRIQGYFYARPMSLDAFISWYQARHA